LSKPPQSYPRPANLAAPADNLIQRQPTLRAAMPAYPERRNLIHRKTTLPEARQACLPLRNVVLKACRATWSVSTLPDGRQP
ncbi:MAG TPA: hypothetical protein VH394_05855, partial [Thermoanaerobaculia bacterium]|nr:hypothetical protein [Thermoanaerobaculia bacterium]